MKKLFVDFDSTIVDTQKAMIQTYYEIDATLPLTPTQLYSKKWNFEDAIPNSKEEVVEEIFCSKSLFDKLEPFEGAIEVLEEISKVTDIYIVSIGRPENIVRKIKYIEKFFPFCKFLPIIQTEKVVMDKSIINMQNGIMIDDHPKNLESSNCSVSILFSNNGVICEYAENWKGLKATKWNDNLKKFLLIAITEK